MHRIRSEEGLFILIVVVNSIVSLYKAAYVCCCLQYYKSVFCFARRNKTSSGQISAKYCQQRNDLEQILLAGLGNTIRSRPSSFLTPKSFPDFTELSFLFGVHRLVLLFFFFFAFWKANRMSFEKSLVPNQFIHRRQSVSVLWKDQNVLPKVDTQQLWMKPPTVRPLILTYSTLYYWDKPMWKSKMWVLHYILYFVKLYHFIIFIVCSWPLLLICSFFFFFEGPKHHKPVLIYVICWLWWFLSDLFFMLD